MSKELTLFSELPVKGIISSLAELGIIRVPQRVYQIMFDSINFNHSIAKRQEQVRKILLDWLADSYPDKELVDFIDLDSSQAEKLRSRVPEITFGMYLKLVDKPSIVHLTTISQQLLDKR